MVKIIGYTERQAQDGKKFYSLILQGEMDLVLSETTGKYYATAKQASITSTFDEATCKSLVGKQLPGRIVRTKCEPFEYTVQETGEVRTLTHRWTYDPSEAAPAVEEVVYDKQLAGADPFAF